MCWLNFATTESLVDKEKIKSSGKYKEAIRKEIDALIRNGTWEIIWKPEGVKVLSTKWVFSKKEMAEGKKFLKARLVARGFERIRIVDELRAPVAKLTTFRLFLAVSCRKKLNVRQIDIKNAYLNGHIEGGVFIEVPKYVKVSYGDFICKLYRTIYGLKEAAAIWNRTVNGVLEGLNFSRSESDFCLYFTKHRGVEAYVLLYVDDVLIASDSEARIEEVVIVCLRILESEIWDLSKDFLG